MADESSGLGGLIAKLLAKLSPATIKRGLHGTLRRAKAAASDGQGAFLVVILFLGVAASLLHRSLDPLRVSEDYLSRALDAKQEPLRGESRPVLAGLLLPSGSSDFCSTPEGKDFVGLLDQRVASFTTAFEAR